MSLLVDIQKRLGDFRLNVQLEAGEQTLALLGASGCGKSVTLCCIAGILRPDSGHIEVNGRTLFDSKRRINLPPQQRKTGLLFQNYALFPHMTVYENLRCGAKKSPLARQRMDQVLHSFHLQDLKNHYPHQLSGGQQQRVALGRLLLSDPDILLLDEPFSALDSHLRFEMEGELRQLLHSFPGTALLVSHDRDEVFRLADTLAVMDGGTVDICGPKEQVFSRPGTLSAARLTGCKNLSPLKKLDETHLIATAWNLPLATDEPIGDAVYVGIFMHDVIPGTGENAFSLSVKEVVENPFSYTVVLQSGLGMEVDKPTWARLGSNDIQVCLPREKLLLLR
ncbi:MAG: ATP-binding cassette domain-containing protein [Clostridia bacterium]|nr:ATP-binding cassette domain-containing protein [Clostridia bacterium]